MSNPQGWPHGGPPHYPGGYPGYDPMGPWSNPGQTIPYPTGSNVPVGGWFGQPTQPAWEDGDGEYVFRTATWRSPIFDLHPEFRGVTENPANTQAIWNRSGCLHVVFEIPSSSVTLLGGLNVVAYEAANPVNAKLLSDGDSYTTNEYDVTGYFPSGPFDAKNAAHLKFTPGGYAVRYWQVFVRFDITTVHNDPSGITAWAGYY